MQSVKGVRMLARSLAFVPLGEGGGGYRGKRAGGWKQGRAAEKVRKRGMKRKRLESMGNGLGMFEGYDPVVESMLLEWEIERQATPGGRCPRTIDVARQRDEISCRADSGVIRAADTSKGTLHTSCVQEAGVAWGGQSGVKELRDVV